MSGRHGPRLVVLDDGLFYRSDSAIISVAATFHRYVEAVADAGGFVETRYVVPVLDHPPDHLAEAAAQGIDTTLLTVVPTEPFTGIADYVRRWPLMVLHNWPALNRALVDADLVWLRLPASNAALAMAAARRRRVPWFTWVAGSVSEVVGGQRRPPLGRLAAGCVGVVYDAVTAIATTGGPTLRLNRQYFASVVSEADIGVTASAIRQPGLGRGRDPLHVMWVGRMAPEKGLDDLLAAMTLLERTGRRARLTIIGDGPERPQIERHAALLHATDVRFAGYVHDRMRLMDMLRSADVVVNPSRAEGVPKTIVEAMAAGTPIVATDVGAVREILGGGERGWLVPSRSPAAIARAIEDVAQGGADASLRVRSAFAWAAGHTVEAQSQRLVRWLERSFPELPWTPSPR